MQRHARIELSLDRLNRFWSTRFSSGLVFSLSIIVTFDGNSRDLSLLPRYLSQPTRDTYDMLGSHCHLGDSICELRIAQFFKKPGDLLCRQADTGVNPASHFYIRRLICELGIAQLVGDQKIYLFGSQKQDLVVSEWSLDDQSNLQSTIKFVRSWDSFDGGHVIGSVDWVYKFMDIWEHYNQCILSAWNSFPIISEMRFALSTVFLVCFLGGKFSSTDIPTLSKGENIDRTFAENRNKVETIDRELCLS